METQTETTAAETTTTAPKKAPSSTYYTAVVDHFYGPEEKAPAVEFITAKTRTDLQKLIADPKVNNVYGIFKGKQIKFALQRKIAF
jgi:hypothetical protein